MAGLEGSMGAADARLEGSMGAADGGAGCAADGGARGFDGCCRWLGWRVRWGCWGGVGIGQVGIRTGDLRICEQGSIPLSY